MVNFIYEKGRKKGVTLVELIIVLAIGIVILGVIYEIYNSQYKMYLKSVDYDKVQVNGANCIAYIRESIINSDTVQILIPRAGGSLVSSSILPSCKDIVKIIPHSDSTDTLKPYVIYTISNNILYRLNYDKNGNFQNKFEVASDVDDDEGKTYISSSAGNSYTISIQLKTSSQPFTTVVSKIWG